MPSRLVHLWLHVLNLELCVINMMCDKHDDVHVPYTLCICHTLCEYTIHFEHVVYCCVGYVIELRSAFHVFPLCFSHRLLYLYFVLRIAARFPLCFSHQSIPLTPTPTLAQP